MQNIILFLFAVCSSVVCGEIQTPYGEPLASCVDGHLVEYASLPCDAPTIITIAVSPTL